MDRKPPDPQVCRSAPPENQMSTTRAEPIARQLSVQAVMEAVLTHGSITRTQLSAVTGLSKQTMSQVVGELERAGWLRVSGRATGSVGRRAIIYEFEKSACSVLGVDLGGSNLRAALASLDGDIAIEASEPTDRRGGTHVIDQISALVARLVARTGIDRSKVRQGVIAVSGIAQRSTGAVLAASNIPGLHELDFAGLLHERLALPLNVENAVDMATLGEQWRGGARGLANFVFIAHGAGIGLGAVVDGRLLKGRRGAIGEIAFLPIGDHVFDPRAFDTGSLEASVGAHAMTAKFEAYGGTAGASVRDIVEALHKGERAAEAVIDETARMVAMAIASVMAVLDPELVVMGGNIGLRPEIITRLRKLLARCTPLTTRIEPSALGSRAQLVGAVGSAIGLAYEDLFGLSAPVSLWSGSDLGLPRVLAHAAGPAPGPKLQAEA